MRRPFPDNPHPYLNENYLEKNPNFLRDLLSKDFEAFSRGWSRAAFGAPDTDAAIAATKIEIQKHMERTILETEKGYSEIMKLAISPDRVIETVWDQMQSISRNLSAREHLGKVNCGHFPAMDSVSPMMPFADDKKMEDFCRLAKNDSDALSVLNLPDLHCRREEDNPYSLEIYGTPLSISVACTVTQGAVLLIQAGVNINQYVAQYGNTPFLLAITKGWNHVDPYSPENSQKPIIEALLARSDLNINLPHFRNGMTALHIACLRGDNPELIQGLIVHGANPNAVDVFGRKPADLLTLSYEEAQRCLLDLLIESSPFHGNDGKLSENQTHVATLPTREERTRNVAKLREMLGVPAPAQGEKSESEESVTSQKSPRFFSSASAALPINFVRDYPGVFTLIINEKLDRVTAMKMDKTELTRLNTNKIPWLIIYGHLAIKDALEFSPKQVEFFTHQNIYDLIVREPHLPIEPMKTFTDDQYDAVLQLSDLNSMQDKIREFLPSAAPRTQ